MKALEIATPYGVRRNIRSFRQGLGQVDEHGRLCAAATAPTTRDIAAAGAVTTRTIARWVQQGLLPAPKIVYGGRRGKRVIWPADAVERAAQVRVQFERGQTRDEILEDRRDLEGVAGLEALGADDSEAA